MLILMKNTWFMTWVSEVFCPREGNRGFFKNFPEKESGDICFFPLETEKTNFVYQNF